MPVVCTGNDFSTLYAPLIRDGRMEKFYWAPTREDRIGVCMGIFQHDGVTRGEVETIVDTFPGQSIDFFGALRVGTPLSIAGIMQPAPIQGVCTLSIDGILSHCQQHEMVREGMSDSIINELPRIAVACVCHERPCSCMSFSDALMIGLRRPGCTMTRSASL